LNLERTSADSSADPVSALPPASNGLVWALISFVLDLIEVVVLIEILFFDKPALSGDNGTGLLHIYFAVMLAATIGQGLGVLLVTRGWYRSGGAMQVVSSAVQVFKVDGIIGVVGGVKAWRYAANLGSEGRTA